jgi:lactate dehydrogenase-like 2-hydroxyacid dehydrogenase
MQGALCQNLHRPHAASTDLAMTTKPALWITIPVAAEAMAIIGQRFDVIHTKSGYGEAEIAQAKQKDIVAVLTNGSIGLSSAAINAFPNLKVIACFGAGFENVDHAAARARGIVVTHAPGVNDANVADHALALMLGVARDLPGADRAVRAGKWETSRIYRPSLNGKRLGVIGLGNIGMRIARRGEAFEMSVAYCTRTPKDVPWKHYSDVVSLAENSDYLVAACPGGPATRHLVNAEVLAALGQQGIFVNIARGSVLDTNALIDALERDVILGAGLDVIDGEPAVPEALMQSPKVLMTPHMAGRTPDVIPNQVDLFTRNVMAVLEGHPAPNVVPV